MRSALSAIFAAPRGTVDAGETDQFAAVLAQGNVAHFVAVRADVVVDQSMTKVAPAW